MHTFNAIQVALDKSICQMHKNVKWQGIHGYHLYRIESITRIETQLDRVLLLKQKREIIKTLD